MTTPLNVITPDVSVAFDDVLLRKKRAIKIRQGVTAYLRLEMIDLEGNPVDITAYTSYDEGPSPEVQVKVRFREAALVIPTIYEVEGVLVSGSVDTIECYIPSEVSGVTGIYLAEVGILDSEDNLFFTNEAYVYVEHSAWHATNLNAKGPPTTDDMRLSLRDNDPLENELLGSYDFGLVELCTAAIRTVVFWNEQPPCLSGATYATTNFPMREVWLLGTQTFLYEMAEEHYRRNRLPHNSGGVSLDDKAKAPDYNKAAQERFQRFRQLVMHHKARMNMARGWGSFGSGYGWSRW